MSLRLEACRRQPRCSHLREIRCSSLLCRLMSTMAAPAQLPATPHLPLKSDPTGGSIKWLTVRELPVWQHERRQEKPPQDGASVQGRVSLSSESRTGVGVQSPPSVSQHFSNLQEGGIDVPLQSMWLFPEAHLADAAVASCAERIWPSLAAVFVFCAHLCTVLFMPNPSFSRIQSDILSSQRMLSKLTLLFSSPLHLLSTLSRTFCSPCDTRVYRLDARVHAELRYLLYPLQLARHWAVVCRRQLAGAIPSLKSWASISNDTLRTVLGGYLGCPISCCTSQAGPKTLVRGTTSHLPTPVAELTFHAVLSTTTVE